MSMTDPLADLITRIRNGQQARLVTIAAPHSKVKESLLVVLKKEGYIRDYKPSVNEKSGKKELRIELKYSEGKPVISEINRVSKPGRRVYSNIDDLQKFFNGLGVVILSTSKGVLTDHDARQLNVGGEVLCEVF